jgi:hypothetical protein
MPTKIQLGEPSGLKAPKMNRNAKMINTPAVMNAIILPARIDPPLFTMFYFPYFNPSSQTSPMIF